MSKVKELIICIIAISFLVLSITTNIFAQNIDVISSNNNNNNANTNANEFVTVPEITSTNTNTNTNTNINTNRNTNTNTIPYTGSNNFSIIVLIGVCGIVAVYAYKKIKDYDNI